jgi:geranylgeranyl diphosphate synthase type I
VVSALARGDEAADELAALLAGELDDGAVRRAADLLDACGIRREMQDVADSSLHQAEAALQRTVLVPEPAAELLAVAHYVAARDR